MAQRPFDTIEELDAVSYVGPSALDKLYTYAFDLWGSADDVFGYLEDSEEAVAILELANEGSESTLHAIGLDEAVVSGILHGRPYANLVGLSAVCHMSPEVFDALVAHATDQAACPAGKVVSTNGWVYDDLPSAIEEAAPGVELQLCEGTYSTDLHGVIPRVSRITGLGPHKTTLLSNGFTVDEEGETHLADLTLQPLPNESYVIVPAKVFVDNVVFDSWVYGDSVQHFIAYGSTFHGGVTIVGRGQGTSEFVADDCVFTRETPVTNTVVVADISATVRRTTFHNHDTAINPQGDATLYVENVDFGLGADDNTISDIRFGYGSTAEHITWWYDDVTAYCESDADSCVIY